MVRRRDRVAGALLVGGASTRFGSPKALATFEGETLAERGHRVLVEAFDRVVVVGKAADALPLPFPVEDDGSEVRAAIVGVAAALRLAGEEVVVVLPTDMPLVTADLLRSLAERRGTTRTRPCRRRGPFPARTGGRRSRSSSGGSSPVTSRSTARSPSSRRGSCSATNACWRTSTSRRTLRPETQRAGGHDPRFQSREAPAGLIRV